MKRKITKGLIYIFIGLICLLLTLLINKYIDISDVFTIILMIISLLIELFGLILIIKDKNYWGQNE